ncbi:MAG TPA: ATP-binding protein [Kofleriaceae bacterium]|nr:ATP-binding protein [Kofleriaceae bacterium]
MLAMAASDTELDACARLRATFLEELPERFERLIGGLLALEGDANDGEAINLCFREAHSIKGSAATVEFMELAELAHVLEELMVRWRSRALVPSRGQIGWALEAVDLLKEAAEQSTKQAETTNVVRRDQRRADATLRVQMKRLDTLVEQTGELYLTLRRLEQAVRGRPDRASLVDSIDDAVQRADTLQDEIRDLRLVPLHHVFQRLARTVSDTARKADKLARLEISGGDIEVDASIADGLVDPLSHMLRNAVDHGIEKYEARRAAGKPSEGVVRLGVRRETGMLVIEVSDDGAGLPRQKLAQKAVSLGLCRTEADLDERAMVDLIFRPGLSTAAQVTDISGRGVGMDVVRQTIETQLRGKISVSSRDGLGTTFTLRVPTTLSVIDGFYIDVGGRPFLLPAERVVELLDDHAGIGREPGVCEVHGRALPRLDLADSLGVVALGSRRNLVVVSHADGHVVLVVDRVRGTTRTVLRPLGPLFTNNRRFAGSTVLPDGDVALLLDLNGLIDAAARAAAPV